MKQPDWTKQFEILKEDNYRVFCFVFHYFPVKSESFVKFVEHIETYLKLSFSKKQIFHKSVDTEKTTSRTD